MARALDGLLIRVRNRVMLAVFMASAVRFLACALITLGTLILVLRYTLDIERSQAARLLWLLPLAPAAAWLHARRLRPSLAAAAAWVDLRSGASGLVLT